MSETSSRSNPTPSTIKVLFSFAIIYVVWGTTYLAMKLALESMPPVFIAGIRFFLAGLGLFAVLLLCGVARPKPQQWRNAAIIGTLLMAGGNGMVMLSIGSIPTGVAAVIVATMPLWTALIDWLFYRGAKPNLQMIIGLMIGFAGIVLLIDPFGSANAASQLNVVSCLICLMAPMFWAIGSLQSRQMDLPSNPFMSGAAQMICGGFVLLIGSGLKGEFSQLAPDAISAKSLLALLYLMVFGSVVGLTAYVWLLKNVNVARVTTYTYANPVIAVVLGWIVLDEQVTLQMMLAIGIVVSAVILIVSSRAKLSLSSPQQAKARDQAANTSATLAAGEETR